jgi:hypothetical protein
MKKYLITLSTLLFIIFSSIAQQKKSSSSQKNSKPKIQQPAQGKVIGVAESREEEIESTSNETNTIVVKINGLKKKVEVLEDLDYLGKTGLRGIVDGNRDRLGFVDSLNNLVIPMIYDAITSSKYFSYGYSALTKKGKFGVIDKFNNEILPFIYDNIRLLTEENNEKIIYVSGIATELNGKWGISNNFGNPIVPNIYDEMVAVNNQRGNILSVIKNKKAGVIDQLGNIIIPPVYDNSMIFPLDLYNGKYQISDNGLAKIIDIKKNKVFNKGYSHIKLESGLSMSKKMIFSAKLTNEGAWGIIDEDENILVPFEFEGIQHTYTGTGNSSHYLVRKNGKMGVFDAGFNKLIIEPKYSELRYDYNNLAGNEYYWGSLNNKWGVLKDGKVILAFDYDNITSSSDNRNILRITKGETTSSFGLKQHKIISQNENPVWKEKYLNVNPYSELKSSQYFIAEKTNGDYGLIDADENIIIPFGLGISPYIRVDEVDKDSEPINFIVERNNKSGLFNKKTKSFLTDTKYYNLKFVDKNGYYTGMVDGKKCLLENGKEIIPPEYDDILYDYNGKVQLSKGGKVGIRNLTTNSYFLDLKYDYISWISDYYVLGLEGKHGLTRISDNKVILPIEYDTISYAYEVREDCFIIGQKGKIGLFSAKMNKVSIPIENEIIVELKNHFIKVFKDNKWAIKHVQYPNISTPFIYQDATMLGDNLFLLDGKKYRFIKDKMIEIPK